jgi:hypothetical protein
MQIQCKLARLAATLPSNCLINPCSWSSLSLRLLDSLIPIPYWYQYPIQLQYNLLCQSTSWIGSSQHGLYQDNHLRALISSVYQEPVQVIETAVYMNAGKAKTDNIQQPKVKTQTVSVYATQSAFVSGRYVLLCPPCVLPGLCLALGSRAVWKQPESSCLAWLTQLKTVEFT